jgi:SAM-dependent methyltransferase
MSNQEEQRKTVLAAAQGAMSLNLAFIGVSGGLFDALAAGPASAADLAARAGADEGYARRWAEAAFAFGLLDRREEAFSLTDLGAAFRPSAPDSLMPFAVQSVLGAHMAERTATLLKTGERPGEKVLAERPAILPWFGPMLEASFGTFFERQILPLLDVYHALDENGGVAVDLGCGNGWYLRKLAARYPRVRGVGLDGFDENIRLATAAAAEAGLADRLSFRAGDIHDFTIPEPVSLVAMNRALHHVWDRKDEVFAKLRDVLLPGGAAVIWEPRWPDDIEVLRAPHRRALAYQNLGEHVQGNHFLRPAEIEAAMRTAGLTPETFLFADGSEAVVVGIRPA